MPNEGGVQFLHERKKIILEVVIGVIVALSLIGNLWAMWDHFTTGIRDKALQEGFQQAVGQMVAQGSPRCGPVDLPTPDGKAVRFVDIACLQPGAEGAGVAGTKGAAAKGPAPAGGAAAKAPAAPATPGR